MKAQLSSLKSKGQAGFTIVELMVATLVFAVVLVVITFGVLHFTNTYYRGINASTTQNVARSILNTVSQAVQFSGSDVNLTDVTATSGVYCVGNQEFAYSLGNQLTSTSGGHALLEVGSSSCDTSAGTLSSGAEQLQLHMRLTQFSVNRVQLTTSPVTYSPNLWIVNVQVAYTDDADDGLLCDSSLSGAGSCKVGTANLTPAQLLAAGSHLTCRSETGSQFCSVASLSTTVERRVN